MSVRVLHVVTDMRRGGLETMLMNYYRKMDRDKVQFDFLEHRQEESDYDREILGLGGKVYRIPRLNPFSMHYKSILYKFFKEHPEYQIVHVHQDCLSSIILKVAEKCGVKVRIAHSHSNNQDKNLKYLLKLYFKQRISRYATHLFACSEDAGNWMFGGSEFEIINNAIDTKKYEYSVEKRKKIREILGINNNTLVVGHVGRFSPPKNHTYLLQIFQRISEKTDAVLLLVGDGTLRLEIETKIKQLHLEQKVILTGVRNDVADLLQAMDVFVLPSKYEGLGIVAIEAQTSGLPCIVSDGVSKECKQTELVWQIPLSENIDTWVRNILKATQIERVSQCKQVRENGYDLQENAIKLMNFYMQQMK